MKIPYALAVYGEEEIRAVNDVLSNPRRLAPNTQTREFEAAVAKLFSKQYGCMVNSGSSANFLAFALLDLPRGSEVITPVLTFATTVAPILQHGLKPIFVDVNPDTYLIQEDEIEKLITEKTKVLMIPSLLGNIPHLKRLQEIADKYNLYLIEDSCDTLGATYDGKPTGYYSDISTTSFYASHIITAAGGGGMICLNRPEWYRRGLMLRSWGRSSALFAESEDLDKRFSVSINSHPYDGKFIFDEVGYNFQTIELQAAFGLEQLKRLPAFSAIRKKNFEALSTFFNNYKQYFTLPRTTDTADTNWLAFPLTIKEGAPFSRLELVTYLEKNDIQTRPVFTGNILYQPGFSFLAEHDDREKYAVANTIMKNSFLIGCHHGLTTEHIEYLQHTFRKFFNASRPTSHMMTAEQQKGGKAIGFIMTYNCAHLLESTYSRIPKVLDKIIVVDDDSKDKEEAEKIAKKLGIPFFSHEHTGYGGNVRYGLTKCLEMGGEYMIEIHGDGQFDPSIIPAALERIRNERYDFFIGSRFTNLLQPLRDGMSLARYLANIGLSFIDRLILRAPLSEYNAGFRVYSRRLAQTLPLGGIRSFERMSSGHIYSFQVIAQAAYFKLKFGEMPIRADYKKEHTSISIPESTIYAFQTFYVLLLFILARLGFKTRLFKKSESTPKPVKE